MKLKLDTAVSLGILTFVGLSFAYDANADSIRQDRHTSKRIQACIAEIGAHADYGDASRVVHWVAGLNQKTAVELELHVKTAVHGRGSDKVIREYVADCTTGTWGELIEFRINQLED
mgnify:FL=1